MRAATLLLLTALGCVATQAQETQVLGSFESRADLSGWLVDAGAQWELSDEHATAGERSLHLSFPEGRGLLRLDGPLDWSGWELLKLDVHNPGDAFTMTFRADDANGETISSWYHLVRSGASTLEVSVRGLAEGIALGRIAWVHLRVDPALGKPCEVFTDNWRLTRGVPTEVWQPQIPPAQRPIAHDPTNLLDNADFELGLQGWGSWGMWDGGDYRFGSGTGQDAYSGRHSAAIYCVKQGRGGIFTQPFRVPSAGTYMLRVRARGAQPGPMRLGYISQDVSKVEEHQVTDQWAGFSLSVDLPEGHEGRVYLMSVSEATVFFDQAYFGREGVLRPAAVGVAGARPTVAIQGDKVAINGKPFFCRGIYRAKPEDLAGTAFNFIPGWDSPGGLEAVPEGVWIMPDLSGLARAHLLYQLGEAIALLKSHPAVMGWYLCDEPDHEKWPVGPDELKLGTQIAHREDPGGVTMTVVMPWAASNLYRFADSVDILATDSYPIRAEKPSPVLNVAQATDWACRATGNERPVWLVVQGTAAATPSEEVAVTYLALTHGADGVLYWEYDDARRKDEVWQTILALGREMQTLEPALMSPDAADQPRASDERIHCLAKQAEDGLYILCINAHHDAVTGVRLTGVGAGPAEVLFEDRSIPADGGAITDDFEAYARHVYKLPAR